MNKVLIYHKTFSSYILKETNLVPRIGEKVWFGYESPPVVIDVIYWPELPSTTKTVAPDGVDVLVVVE